jgi:cytochrome c553
MLLEFVALLTASVALATSSLAAADIQFNRDIRPILSETCFRCHGPDSAARKADLRFDRREVAISVGAIVPGKPEKSEMISRIFSDDPDTQMPPPDSHKSLTAAQKDLLKRWIAAGAEYQPLWSFIAPKRPELPAVKNEGWVKNAIDRFILAKLEEKGLQPAAEADRRTLARRVSLDLTGLPPTPEDVERFITDKSPDAYEQYVDRLLASPRWGEHRARYWLDAARYADSNGIHFDNYREIWSFREWVIAAFNRNEPFDQFTVEQLAGDLLPNHSLDQQIASGFNRCNITTNEGGAIPEEYLVLYARDRTETTSQVWLGMTAGCAVCHDHKFDPLSQKEFYALSAFFNNTTQAGMDGNVKDTAPVIFVPRPEDKSRWAAVAPELTTIRKELDERKKTSRGEFDKWVADASAEKIAAMVPTDGLRLQARLNEGSGKTVSMTVDGQERSLAVNSGVAWDAGHVAELCFKSQPGDAIEVAEAGDFDNNQPYTAAAWVKLSKGGQYGAVVAREDDEHGYRGWDLWVENGKVGAHLINAWDSDAMKVLSKKVIKPGEWNHLMVTYDGSGKAEGLKIFVNGDLQPTQVMVDQLKSTTRTSVPLKIAQRNKMSRLDGALIQDVRIYGRALAAPEAMQLAKATRAAWLATKPKEKRTPKETEELFAWWLTAEDKPTQELFGRLAGLEQEESAMKGRGTVAHVMQEKGDQPMAYVLYRGEYDKRRDPVKPETPSALPPMPSDLPKTRLGLARWLVRPEHPLMARVTVNRFWQETFGTGLVRTAGDFGSAGEPPSHPELLDWLAVEFRESGWDVKKFFRSIVTSAAYRQAATLTPEKLERDSQNRLLSRGPRFRMDGEMIRDYALDASGLLSPKIGGPSVRPYQPPKVWEAVAMPESDTRVYKQDHGESLYRRSLYTFWKRAAPPASMDIFNAPSREVCTVRRERTNTPLQALVTLNDPQFVEAARVLAEHALKVAPQDDRRIDYLAHRLLARPFRAEETAAVQANLKELEDYYKAHGEDAKQLIAVGEAKADPSTDPANLAAWTMLSNELLNLDEVLNK